MLNNNEESLTPKKKWYVVQTYSGYEKTVKNIIEERISKNSEFLEMFGQILIPSEKVIEIKSGKKKKSDRRFFPGYLIINMCVNEKTWTLIRKTPKVIGFVGSKSDVPIPISEKEINRILNNVNECTTDKNPKPKTLFNIGETVRVLEGPFSDFTGMVDTVNYEKSRLQVAVSIFGRPTPVELEFSQVEKEID